MMKPLPKLRTTKGHRRKPRVLICTPEITELPEGMGNAANYIHAKGGGLGDISAGLIRYLYEDGRFQLHVALPKYDSQIRDRTRIGPKELDVLAPLLDRKGIHLVTDSAFSHLDDVYSDGEAHPRVHRAVAFQRHIINHLLDAIRPDVVHCNDWMTGLVPPAAREKGIKSLFTLHNVFTERETPRNIDRSGIDVRRFQEYLYYERFPDESPENWLKNKIDFAASGIHAADLVNTVSKTFLEEMVRGDFEDIVPKSLSHVVREKYAVNSAMGILNAPNNTIKAINKRAFQMKMGLKPDPEAPLFFWPSRLYTQKGPELLYKILRRAVETHNVQVALVANGDPTIERMFRFLSRTSRGHVAHRQFSEGLSELGKAASDFVLMPSKYEPCGLPQMECPRFGTLPVARLTGGIKDTVFELDPVNGQGNGFVFEEFSPAALARAIHRAVVFHRLSPEVKRANIQRVMRESFDCYTLANTAREYIEIYEEMIASDGNDKKEVGQTRKSQA
ncbi:MAG: glycogen synthase [Planctomycetota bacterium]